MEEEKTWLKTEDLSEGLTLSWRNLSVSTFLKNKRWFSCGGNSTRPRKKLLTNSFGIAHPGKILAIMGASGSGKTTLMDALAHRTPRTMIVNGEICLNGRPTSGNLMQHLSGYVFQEDLFIDTMTVMEHLTFLARLQGSDQELNTTKVRKVLNQLGLERVSGRRIGVGLSGGERKRLSLACQLLPDPPILFCDEPTSGLDSASARELIQLLSQLGQTHHKTVIITVHQPASDLVALFHKILLLAPGDGRLVFCGSCPTAFQFFQSLGYTCPDTYNPSDFFIRTLAAIGGKNGENAEGIEEMTFQFEESASCKQDLMEIDSLHKTDDNTKRKDFQKLYIPRANWFIQVYLLLWRSTLHMIRNPSVHLVRTIQKLFIAVLMGMCYGGISNNQGGIRAVQGAIFLFATENTFPSMYAMIQVIPQDLPVILRDHQAGVYRVDAYYIAKAISVIPTFIIEPVLFTCIAYWFIGLRNSITAFILTTLCCILTANVAAAAGCAFSTAFENVGVSLAYIIPFEYLLMLSAGLFINLRSFPVYVSWTKYFSWFMYCNEAIAITQWHGVTNISCEFTASNAPCIQRGSDVLEEYSFNEGNLVLDFWALSILYFAFHLLGLIFLVIRCRHKS